MQTLVYCTDSSEYWMVKILVTKTSQCQTRKISYFLLCQMDNVCMLAEYSEYFKFSLKFSSLSCHVYSLPGTLVIFTFLMGDTQFRSMLTSQQRIQ